MAFYQSNVSINGGLIKGTDNGKLYLGTNDRNSNFTGTSLINEMYSKHINILNDGKNSNFSIENNLIRLQGDFVIENSKNEPIMTSDDTNISLTNQLITLESPEVHIVGDLKIDGRIISSESISSNSETILKIDNIENKIYELKGRTTIIFNDKTDKVFRFNVFKSDYAINFIAGFEQSGKIKLKPLNLNIVHPMSDNIELSLTAKGQSVSLFVVDTNAYMINSGCDVNFF